MSEPHVDIEGIAEVLVGHERRNPDYGEGDGCSCGHPEPRFKGIYEEWHSPHVAKEIAKYLRSTWTGEPSE